MTGAALNHRIIAAFNYATVHEQRFIIVNKNSQFTSMTKGIRLIAFTKAPTAQIIPESKASTAPRQEFN